MSGREGQIRKCFIRLVSAHRYTKKHIFTSATINNICESMNIEEKNNGITPRDYSDVSELYKKARYSNEPATFKDVSYMKKECQKRFKRN